MSVYLERCESYEQLEVRSIVTKLIKSIMEEKGLDARGKKVLIKPNLLSGRAPRLGVTTHPFFVSAAASYFIELGAQVTIADSPGGVYNEAALRSIYKIAGMQQAAKDSGAMLNYDTSSRRISFKGERVHGFEVIRPIAEAELTVNLARLKTHALCAMSAAVKNMYGAVPGLQKAEMHARFPKRADFASMLVDLCAATAPQINIVDAIEAMEGNGPAHGTLKKVGAVLGSANAFELDAVCADIMGYRPEEVGTLAESIERGYCGREPQIIGEDAARFRTHFKRPDGNAGGLLKQLPSIFGGRLQKWLEPAPFVVGGRCIGCAECVRCCPAQVIKISENKAEIDTSDCIKCYCCQELCPAKAVEVRRRFFFK